MIFRCTAKLLKEMGVRITDVDDSGDSAGFDTWFANLLRLDRHKCILFTQAQTLFSFLVPHVRKSDLSDFGAFFVSHLARSLKAEGLSIEDLPRAHRDSHVVAPTNNRSVLGSMNDLAVQCRFTIEAEGGLSHCDMAHLQRQLNRVPMSAIGYKQAIDRFKEVVRSASGQSPLRLVRDH